MQMALQMFTCPNRRSSVPLLVLLLEVDSYAHPADFLGQDERNNRNVILHW